LKVAFICATPCTTFFFSRRRGFFDFLGVAKSTFLAAYFFAWTFFFPATVFLGPFRVLALV
jgi:hypothetical protein